jgi:hypothetical protein
MTVDFYITVETTEPLHQHPRRNALEPCRRRHAPHSSAQLPPRTEAVTYRITPVEV